MFARSSYSTLATTAAPPLSANAASALKISLRAPTSTPWVGSCRRSTLGEVASHLPRTIFCWFPPLNSPTSISGSWGTTPTDLMTWRVSRSSRERCRTPLEKKVSRRGNTEFSRTVRSVERASLVRSAGTRAMPRFTRPATESVCSEISSPSMTHVPVVWRSLSTSRYGTSSKPEPPIPVNPRISPCFSVKETSCTDPPERFATDNTSLAVASGRSG